MDDHCAARFDSDLAEIEAKYCSLGIKAIEYCDQRCLSSCEIYLDWIVFKGTAKDYMIFCLCIQNPAIVWFILLPGFALLIRFLKLVSDVSAFSCLHGPCVPAMGILSIYLCAVGFSLVVSLTALSFPFLSIRRADALPQSHLLQTCNILLKMHG